MSQATNIKVVNGQVQFLKRILCEGRFGVIPNHESVESAKQVLEYLINTTLPEKDPHFKEYPLKLEFIGASWVPGFTPLDHEFVRKLSNSYEK
ncbi:hypothetical protein ABK040_005722 [Willaertia magna]